MRHTKFVLFALAIAALFAVMPRAVSIAMAGLGASIDGKATLTINADGTAKIVRESVQPRQQLEQTLRMWDRHQNRSEDDDSDAAPPPAQNPGDKAEPKPFTDEELEKKIRATTELAEETYGVRQGKLEKLDIGKDSVTTTMVQSF